MKVRIKSVVKVVSEEELIIIPLARKGDFIEALNFYEDVPGGRAARLVIIHDKYDEIKEEPTPLGIRGKKTYIGAEGVMEDLDKIKALIPIDRVVRSKAVSLYIDIQLLGDLDTSSRGVKGFINYISRYGRLDFSKLKRSVELEVLV